VCGFLNGNFCRLFANFAVYYFVLSFGESVLNFNMRYR